MKSNKKAKMKNVLVSEICNGKRFREDLGDLEDMKESILDKGIIQPITICLINNPSYIEGYGVIQPYMLMAGGRRLACVRELKLETIPAIIRDEEDELDLREIELFENVFRKDMEWPEKTKLVKYIQTMNEEKNKDTPWKWSQRKCAKMLGISQTDIRRKIKLADAIEKIPALAACKDESTARRLLAKMEERVDTNLAVAAQQERIKENPDLAKAAANYIIGDCLVNMKIIADKKDKDKDFCHGVKFIEVDPPYGIDLCNTKVRKDGDTDYDIKAYNEVEKENYLKFLDTLCPLLYRCLDDGGWLVFWFGPTWFADVKDAIIRAGFIVDDVPAIWTKNRGQTAAPNYKLAGAYEPFFVGRKGNAILKNKGRLNVFTFAPVSQVAKYHPTQRPDDLMDAIFDTFGTPGTTCIIPFLGSGVSLRAAYRKGMLGFGWDLSEEYRNRFLLDMEHR